MTTETTIAIVSCLGAVISALMAWHSAKTARRALTLAEIDYREKHDALKVYLIDGACWRNDHAVDYVAFACSFTNSANAPNTVIRVDLITHAYDESGNLSQAILHPVVQEAPPLWDLKTLCVPINLEPRSTVSGWISFKVPKQLINKKRIDKYELASVTSLGERAIVESYLLRRLRNEDRQD
ncbi:hypothetical protein [Azoarcus sp. CIB]|uniref:hypothetical protein n=1 Tax=Aromatoleum sp. (strain CIB) TaxID=198107 RepID=UPI0012EEDA70|nr:hypothetical protein [Azoarcus sp. CIB]